MTVCDKTVSDGVISLIVFFVRNQAMPSYLEKLEADREAQHSGYGVQPYLCADGSRKWEAYSWERITELQLHHTSYGIFDHKWQAEQYFNNCIYG